MNEWQEDWPTLPERYLDLIVAEGMSRMNAAVERVIASCETHQIEVKPGKVDTWNEVAFSRRLEIQRWLAMGDTSQSCANLHHGLTGLGAASQLAGLGLSNQHLQDQWWNK